MGGFAGGGKGSSGSSGGNGLSGADIALIQQALGMSTEELTSRYQQLGLGVPQGGTGGGVNGPAVQAAAGGKSLQYGSMGTAEQMDVQGLGNIADAAMGQLQNANQNNPAIPGSFANQLQTINSGGNGFQTGLNSLASAAGIPGGGTTGA